MITFSGNAWLQGLVARQLERPDVPSPGKLFMLEVIAGSPLEELPVSWTEPLGRLLASDDSKIRSGVLDLVESRSIPALNREIEKIIQDPGASPDFRIRALSARAMSSPRLSDDEFTLLTGYLGSGYDSPVRQAAVRL